MYDETPYEEYMRSVLGYKPMCCDTNIYSNNDYYIMPMSNMQTNNNELDELYPEIYKRVYPLVCNECNNVVMPLKREVLEQMTENVYKSIEIDLKIETKNVSKQEDRQVGANNNFLRDLIRILILQQIIGGGNRPQVPPRPPRPPFPGGPNPGPRPPRPPFPPQGPRTN